jgi:putative membrane protein
MKTTLFFLLVFGLASIGCSSNKAAENNSSNQGAAQPASTDNSSQNSSSTASNSASANPTGQDSDQQFLTEAVQGNRAEVELGKMVAAKAHDPSVKQFAQLMVKDHTNALNQLQQLAQQKNVNVPEGLPPDAQDLQSKLQNDTGKQFDKDYMDGMVQDHEKDVQSFQDASQNAKDPDVKQLATKLTPTLQEHLAKAQQIDQKLNSGKGSSPSGD